MNIILILFLLFRCKKPKLRRTTGKLKTSIWNRVEPSFKDPCSFPINETYINNVFDELESRKKNSLSRNQSEISEDTQRLNVEGLIGVELNDQPSFESCKKHTDRFVTIVKNFKKIAYETCKFQSACVSHDRCLVLAKTKKFPDPKKYNPSVNAKVRTKHQCNDEFLTNLMDIASTGVTSGMAMGIITEQCRSLAAVMWAAVHVGETCANQRRSCALEDWNFPKSLAATFKYNLAWEGFWQFPGYFLNINHPATHESRCLNALLSSISE